MSVPTTHLYKKIGTTDTTITVFNPVNQAPSSPGIILIESEQIHYQSADQSNYFGCTRGYNSTSAATHAANVAVSYVSADTPTGEGNITATAPVTVTGGANVLVGGSAVVALPAADATHDGYLAQGNFATKDTDGTLAANSDTRFATQKATKTYADTKLPLAGGTVSGIITLQKAPAFQTTALATTGTITPDATVGPTFTIAVSGAVTLNGPTGGVNGQKVTFAIDNDASHAVTLATGAGNFRFGTDITSYANSVSKRDYIGAIWNNGASRWDVVSIVKGF